MKYLIPILAAMAICGCATKPKVEVRKAIPSPDVAIVKVPVVMAKESNVKASERVNSARAAVSRGSALVEKIKPSAPEQAAAVEQELQAAALELVAAEESLASTQQALETAIANTDKVQADVSTLKERATSEQTRADGLAVDLRKAADAHKKTLAAYHRLKFGVALIVAVVAWLLAARLAGSGIFMANPWIQIGVPVAVGLGVFALLFLIL